MTNNYDIFISYRRDGGAQYARILQLMLIQRGYKVFLDYDELRDGSFSDRIKAAIKVAPVFMPVLSAGSMARCVNEDDWMSVEILLAVQEGKHFVPIDPDHTFDGVPEGVPTAIKEAIEGNQHSEVSFGQLLGVSVEQMITDRLIEKVGARIPQDKKDYGFDAAQETLRQKDERKSLFSLIRNLFIKENKNDSLIDNYVPKKVDYDIFISYRRVDGRDHARNIQQAFKAHGYKNIFFDYDSIQKGEFNKRIIDAIYSCSDFILVLSPKSMKRCVNSGDPVANEIRTALKYKKNIIPVTIDGKEVEFPRKFPQDLSEIITLQRHDHRSDSYFEHSIDELCEKLACKKTDDRM